jgi:ubiquinone/menaquinone biosynthesis C-methylase UbiE
MNTDLKVPQGGSNFFGDSILSIKEIIKDTEVAFYIENAIRRAFEGTMLDDSTLDSIVKISIQNISITESLLEYESKTYNELNAIGAFQNMSLKINGRAESMTERTLPYLHKSSVLDLGCGPGKVGYCISQKSFDVTLADVYENPNIQRTGLPFHIIKQNDTLPFKDKSFDNVLIFAMLHHTESPLFTLQESDRILTDSGRLHLIETVYGIDSSIVVNKNDLLEQIYLKLTFEQQRSVNMFLDYYGNHITWYHTTDPQKYVPVPFNFFTPDKIIEVMTSMNYKTIKAESLGIDPGGVMYQMSFVFEKNI